MNKSDPSNRDGCDCSIIIPTRNRSAILGETLRRLHALPDRRLEIIVVDNGSTDGSTALRQAFGGVRWIDLDRNLGCAARNVGAAAARGRVLLMLDDDSWPEARVVEQIVALFDARPRLGAAACRVRLADSPSRHDAGGVAGTYFNCGGAIRRSAFVECGGYPIDFEYYVEEYDLSCRLWKAGWTIEPRGELVVHHRRVSQNRDNDNMLRLLVRNNLVLWQRYAPDELREDLIESTLERYRRVAIRESALVGFVQGREEGFARIGSAKKSGRRLSSAEFADLMGLSAARAALIEWADNARIEKVAVWTRGKACELLIDLITSINIRVDAVYDFVAEEPTWRGVRLRHAADFDPAAVDGIVAGSLSPGVAEDIAHDLAEKMPGLPILSPAPWRGVATAVSPCSV
jgi:GT2 family glycosyltransferase